MKHSIVRTMVHSTFHVMAGKKKKKAWHKKKGHIVGCSVMVSELILMTWVNLMSQWII